MENATRGLGLVFGFQFDRILGVMFTPYITGELAFRDSLVFNLLLRSISLSREAMDVASSLMMIAISIA